MNEKYKYLSKNIFLFSISGFVPRILSFLMVPFYTSVLTPEDYGIADLISTTVMLLVPIFTLDMQDAVFRYSLDKEYDNGDVISVAFKTLLIGGLAVTIGAVGSLFLKIPWLKAEYVFFVVVTYFAQAAGSILNMFCRGLNEVKAITISSIVSTIITIPANIVFLAFLKWGITGYLIANVLGQLVADLYLASKAQLNRYFRWQLSKTTMHEMMRYSIPLIFNVVAWWINSVSDRYILSWLSGVAVSGIFAVALKIPSILSVFQGVFYQAWSISAIKDFDRDDKDGFITRTYTMTAGATALICSGIMFFNMPLSWFLYSKDFFQAWKYVPVLLMAFFFNAMALFVGAIFTAVKDTKNISYSTFAGAAVNIVATLLLTYLYGALGAALAMLLGYLTVYVYRSIKVSQHIHMKINWKRDILAYILLIIQMIAASFGWIGMALQAIPMLALFWLFRGEFKFVVEKVKAKFH